MRSIVRVRLLLLSTNILKMLPSSPNAQIPTTMPWYMMSSSTSDTFTLWRSPEWRVQLPSPPPFHGNTLDIDSLCLGRSTALELSRVSGEERPASSNGVHTIVIYFERGSV